MLVSKEVSTLENEILEFKELLAEWKGMPSLLHIDDSASVAGTSRPSLDHFMSSHLHRAPPERPLLNRRPAGALCEPDANTAYAD